MIPWDFVQSVQIWGLEVKESGGGDHFARSQGGMTCTCQGAMTKIRY